MSDLADRTPRCWLIVPAAGAGRRMESAVPKQYLTLHRKTILELTLRRLDQVGGIEQIIVVLSAGDSWWPGLKLRLATGFSVATGGKRRADSVFNGLQAIQAQAHERDWVLVHDAVRPCVSVADVRKMRSALQKERAGGLLAVPVRETLKKADAQRRVEKTVPRENYWLAATPQMFRFGLVFEALQKAIADDLPVTDEASAVERLGLPVKLIAGRADNIKITCPEDLTLAGHILALQEEAGSDD